jgi:hypothetical protein
MEKERKRAREKERLTHGRERELRISSAYAAGPTRASEREREREREREFERDWERN